MGDPGVVQLFHVSCDWGELAWIRREAINGVFPLHLRKKDTFNIAFLLQILTIQRLISILLHPIRSIIKFIGPRIQQPLLIHDFILNIRIIMSMFSYLVHVWYVLQIKLTFLDLFWGWLRELSLGIGTVQVCSVSRTQLTPLINISFQIVIFPSRILFLEIKSFKQQKDIVQFII